MIVRTGTRSYGLGATTEVTVDPIVLTRTTSDGQVQTVTGPSGEIIQGTPPAAFNWWWVLAALAGGLVIGWWLSEDGARRPLPPT